MFGSRDISSERVVAGERHRGLGAVLLVLALTLTGGSWYAYQALHRHEVALTSMAVAMSDQAKSTSEMLGFWADDQHSLRDQIAKLGQKMEMRIATVANEAQVFSSEMYRQVRAEIDDRLKDIDTRLTHIESSSESQQTRIEELQRQLGEVRSHAPSQADDPAAVQTKMEESGATRARQFARPQQSEEGDHRDVDALGNKLAVHRVDFEVTKNHSRQLAEGISLGVTSTDMLHRSASGWMWVMPDRRTIWLKAQNAGEPVVFYGTEDSKKRELVITNVTEGSIIGYLLLAGESGSREMASARSNKY
jgi:chromosome segregation ATPase